MGRIAPLAPDRLDGDRRAMYEEMTRYMRRDEPGVADAREDGALIGPFAPMLRFPRFGRGAWDYTKLFMGPGTLPERARQVAILTVAARMGAGFELHAHEIVAADSGLTEAQVATLAAGRRPPGLDREQGIAHAVAAALVGGGGLPDSTYRLALSAFAEDGTAELIFLVGSYTLLAIVINGYDVAVPEIPAARPPSLNPEE